MGHERNMCERNMKREWRDNWDEGKQSEEGRERGRWGGEGRSEGERNEAARGKGGVIGRVGVEEREPLRGRWGIRGIIFSWLLGWFFAWLTNAPVRIFEKVWKRLAIVLEFLSCFENFWFFYFFSKTLWLQQGSIWEKSSNFSLRIFKILKNWKIWFLSFSWEFLLRIFENLEASWLILKFWASFENLGVAWSKTLFSLKCWRILVCCKCGGRRGRENGGENKRKGARPVMEKPGELKLNVKRSADTKTWNN